MCSVAAGAHHSVLIAAEATAESQSNVWTFGLDHCLGRQADGGEGSEEDSSGTPRPICGFPDPDGAGQPTIAFASASEYHTMLADVDGRVFSCGLGGGGRLGLGDEEDAILPRLVAGPLITKRVLSVAAGQSFSLAVTDEGSVYSWGTGARGELGLGDEDVNSDIDAEEEEDGMRRLEPRLIQRCDDGSAWGERVVDVAAGKNHALAVTEEITEEGNVFGWGFGEEYQFGIELDDPEEELVEAFAPMRIPALRCVRD